MGMSAGLFALRSGGQPDSALSRSERQQEKQSKQAKMRFFWLIVFSAGWGFVYGAVMNLWSWPFQSGEAAQSWQAGLSPLDGLKRYAVFYLATSLWWDFFAAVGNVVLIWVFGPATIKALERFKRKFIFEEGLS